MAILFTNNALSKLASGISNTANTLAVTAGTGGQFPAVTGGGQNYFVITLENSAGTREFIRVDNRSGDTLGNVTYPLQRGYWGSTAATWVTGDSVDVRWAANAITDYLTTVSGRYLGTYAVAPTLDNFGAALKNGDLYYDSVATNLKLYNGAAWVLAIALANYLPLSGGVLTGAMTSLASLTTGGDAYVLTPSPALGAYTIDNIYIVRFNAANTTTTPTIAISGLPTKTIVHADGTALGVGDISTNMVGYLAYDGTNVRILNSNTLKVNGNTLAAAAGTATVTLPNSTDTLVGRATTDTLTNKTLAGSTNTVGGAQAQNVPVSAIGYVFDGGGSVLTTGVKGDLLIPFACTINSVTLEADQSGSIVIDIWKKTYTLDSPPTVANTITASALPTLAAHQSTQDTTLTGWTTAIAANDMLRFNINSVTTCTRVTLTLKVTKT